jgi:hypothetical protein
MDVDAAANQSDEWDGDGAGIAAADGGGDD